MIQTVLVLTKRSNKPASTKSDHDFNDFEKTSDGHDSDNDGLSDEYEANEACFYEKMGWVVFFKGV